jgi:hypothetical protein
MDDTAKLNDLARAEIAALERDGIRLTPDEIVEINALGWAVQTPETRRLLSRGRPVPLAGEWLWPLTMRAVEWLDRNGYALDRVTPAIGYAMAFGRSDGQEMDTEGRAAERAVKRWFSGLKCTLAEFGEAVQQVDNQDAKPETPPDPSGKPMTLGDLSAFLTATCGGDADFWERRCSLSFCLSTISMYMAQNAAEKRPSSGDPRIIAERALGYAIERVRLCHEAEAVANG